MARQSPDLSLRKKTVQGMTMEEARTLFDKLDVSGDGTISADEFKIFKEKMAAGSLDD